MASTYSGDPFSSPLDETRFLCGDTGPNFALNNDEIYYAIKTVYPPPAAPPLPGNYLPASYCADAIAAKYKRAVDKKVGDLSISYSQMSKQFADLAIQLRRRATIAGVPVHFGGISLAEKVANDLNNNIVQTAIKIDGMDNDWPLHTPSGSGSGPGPGSGAE